MPPIPTTDELAATLAILQGGGWITAAELGDRLGAAGNRENRRRRVRAVVRLLRELGAAIEADLVRGYRLDSDPDPRHYRDYLARRAAHAKRRIGETARAARDYSEPDQLPLFPPMFVLGGRV